MTNLSVVIGANWGDEGKGRVTSFLSYQEKEKNKKVLNVLYNGGVQRGHTADGHIFHCFGSGTIQGATTYYDRKFLVDPVGFKQENEELKVDYIYVHPKCRVVTPFDQILNRKSEDIRGNSRHGSCGMGIFETVKRSKYLPIFAEDLFSLTRLKEKLHYLMKIWIPLRSKELKIDIDDANFLNYLYEVFLESVVYFTEHVYLNNFEDIENKFDSVIFEGAQGLGLSMKNLKDMPHLTPSYTGLDYIAEYISKYGKEVSVNVNYVTRTYITRHGAGPLEKECKKEDINSQIEDLTNVPNEYQSSIRYGYFNPESFSQRVDSDFEMLNVLNGDISRKIIVTHGDYTQNKMCTGKDTFISFNEIFKDKYNVTFLSKEYNL